MKRVDKLNGLKSWWNKNCKPQYRISIPASRLKQECLSEYENTGSVEMRAYQCKLNRPIEFKGV